MTSFGKKYLSVCASIAFSAHDDCVMVYYERFLQPSDCQRVSQANRRLRFIITVLAPAVAVATHAATLIQGRSRPSELSFEWLVIFMTVFVLYTLAIIIPKKTPGKRIILASLTAGTLSAVVITIVYMSDTFNHQIRVSEQVLFLTAISPVLMIVGVQSTRWIQNLSPRRQCDVTITLICVAVYGLMALIASTEALPVGNWLQRSSEWGPVLILCPALCLTTYLLSARAKERIQADRDIQILIIITAIGLLLRTIGSVGALPYKFHPDEPMYIDNAMRLIRTGDFSSAWPTNPPLFQNLLAVVYLLYHVIGRMLGGGDVIVEMTRMADLYPAPIYLMARISSAMIGAMSIPLVYLIARSVHTRIAGLFAALIVAVSFGHVRDSHFATNDIMLCTMVLLSVYCAIRYHRDQRLDWIIASFVTAGFAIATKYNGIIVLLVPAVAGLTTIKRPLSVDRIIGSGRRLATALAGGVALAVILLPFVLKDAPLYLSGALHQLSINRNPGFGQMPDMPLLLWLRSLPITVGWLPLGSSVIGLCHLVILGIMRRLRLSVLIILFVFPVVYLILMSSTLQFAVRFGLPLIPFIAILAGIGADCLISLCRARARMSALVILTVVLVSQPLLLSLSYDVLMFRTDTRISADRWIQENVRPDQLVAVEAYAATDGRLNRWRDRFDREFEGPRYELIWNLGSTSYSALREHGFEFVAVSSFIRDRWLVYGELPSIYGELARESRLVAEFHPGNNNSYLEFRFDEVHGPLWHILGRHLPGPSVWIYALSPSSQIR